ncbi:serine acetyltransferase [Micromonospora tulbaghiae]|uniref:Serine acetyltransferase n=1 Tax=Micromonospora tulbaghiae TaxID=479978 RepID=A0A386WQZ1_9ACTN|nr:serine acetyltransferase [Micromonospora tulbaghiae]
MLEVLLYQGVWAVWAHRVAHRLHRWGIPLFPQMVSQVARLFTGVEIHPGARVGRRWFIDHGAGVVIGQTARTGDDLTMYPQVTLGSRGCPADSTAAERHPIVSDRVVLGVGATLLGPIRVDGDVHVGAHCLVTSDVPAGQRLRAPTDHHPVSPRRSAPRVQPSQGVSMIYTNVTERGLTALSRRTTATCRPGMMRAPRCRMVPGMSVDVQRCLRP